MNGERPDGAVIAATIRAIRKKDLTRDQMITVTQFLRPKPVAGWYTEENGSFWVSRLKGAAPEGPGEKWREEWRAYAAAAYVSCCAEWEDPVAKTWILNALVDGAA